MVMVIREVHYTDGQPPDDNYEHGVDMKSGDWEEDRDPSHYGKHGYGKNDSIHKAWFHPHFYNLYNPEISVEHKDVFFTGDGVFD